MIDAAPEGLMASASESPFVNPPAGYRLPADIRLGPVRLQVADLVRSVAFYDRVLGLSLRQGNAHTAILGTGNGVPLVELHERPGARPVPRRGRLGLFHFALLLPDRAALGRFLVHLSGLGLSPGMSDHLVSEAVYLNDPDGLGIEVYADRPREQWRMEGDNLAMATLPLNVAEVIESGAGAHWSRMPDAARMGHVHLHVGDLERSAAFYHQGLGLDRVVLGYPGAMFLSAGGYHHHLGTNTWATDAEPASDADARLLQWTMRLPTAADLGQVTASLSAGGYAPVTEEGGLLSDGSLGDPALPEFRSVTCACCRDVAEIAPCVCHGSGLA